MRTARDLRGPLAGATLSGLRDGDFIITLSSGLIRMSGERMVDVSTGGGVVRSKRFAFNAILLPLLGAEAWNRDAPTDGDAVAT